MNCHVFNFKIRFSSGRTDFNEIKVKISPLDQNPIRTHNLELMINLNGSDESLIDVNEFIELSYPFKAIAPDYKKKYSFPLDIDVFYPTHQGFLNNGDKSYFKVSNNLNQKLLPSFKIIHNRRDLQIGKEIFPGRTIDEFAINITIRNKSNIALKDFQIKDTISSAFELVSSSTDYNVDNSIDGEGESIQFTIENIQPFQEKEIRYYLKNKSGESIDYEELESYIFS